MSGGLYLTNLAVVVRGAGLVCHEEDGWQFRARSSGGYADGHPTHVMVHHTASGPSSDGQPDVDYMTYVSENEPTANLYLSRAGEVWVMAAGATNTNGSGGPLDNVPADSMNTHAIGIEAGNDGVGEPWPAAMQSAYLTLVEALCVAYNVPHGHVRSHHEWASSRKIDPAGPSNFGVCNSSGTWNMDIFRDDLGHNPTPPPIIEGDDDMAALAYYRDDRPDGWQIWVVSLDGHGQVWTCPIGDLPDGGKWEVVQPIVGDPPTRPFGALVGLMDRQNRPAP